MKQWLTLITTLILAGNLAACGGAPASPNNPSPAPTSNGEAGPPVVDAGGEAAAQATAALTESLDESIIATVNGEPILRADFERTLARREQAIRAADRQSLQNFVLSSMINQVLTEQSAVNLGVDVSEAEVDAELAQLKEIAGDEAAWQQWLDDNMYTEEELRRDLHSELLAARVRDAVVADVAEGNQRQVHARHILVDTEEEALQLRLRLINGESFVDLAAQYSNDVTTRTEGGDLGWFTEDELLEPLVAEVAFNQPEGSISQPVATRLGYHLVETLAFDNLPLPEEKRAMVEQAVFTEWLATLNDSAMIEINQ